MQYKSIGRLLPGFISNPLFGDRNKYGNRIDESDADWIKWQKLYIEFYKDTQKNGIGKSVNDAGYEVFSEVSLDGMQVMEIGAGLLPHYRFWHGKPKSYHVVDVKQEFIDQSLILLKNHDIESYGHIIDSAILPLEDNSIDIILTFYNLEHLNPLNTYLQEFKRILRPKGRIVGAIPCEGGFAWGGGRFLTTRRYVYSRGINYDKIICWEHPNFADTILDNLEQHFKPSYKKFWPVVIPSIDFNLVVKFVYEK